MLYAGANSNIVSWTRILYRDKDLAIVSNFLKSKAKKKKDDFLKYGDKINGSNSVIIYNL